MDTKHWQFSKKTFVPDAIKDNYSTYTIRSTRFEGVELKKGFVNIVCRELTRGHCDGGCGVERRLGLWSSRSELEAKVDVKRLDLEEGVHESDPDLFLDVEKKNGKSL